MSDTEVLVVVSKLKGYIKSKAGLNTAGEVPAIVSQAVTALCDEAIENAKADGRKTVMERDFKLPCSTNTSTTTSSSTLGQLNNAA